MSKLQNNTHFYLQIMQSIKDKIKLGKYKEGENIPTEDMLCEEFNVSKITIRKAVQLLCDEGILVKKQGKGTFVDMPKNIQPIAISQSFNGYCIRNGYKPSVKIINKELVKADYKIAQKLGVNQGDEILKLERLMSIDGVPTIYEIDYFRNNFKFLLSEKLEDNSLLQALIESNVKPIHSFHQNVSVKNVESSITNLLKKEKDYSFLFVEEVVLGLEKEIIYFNIQYIVSGLYNFSVVTYK